MADGEPKINPVAAMENWKAAVIKEQAVAGNWHANWGYLKAKPEECKVCVQSSSMLLVAS